MNQEKKEIKVDGIHNSTGGGYGRQKYRFRVNEEYVFIYKKILFQHIPFLVRTFWRLNEEFTVEQFEHNKIQQLKENQIHLYLTLNSTLRDIVDQVKFQIDGIYRRDSRFKIHSVYLDIYGVPIKKNISQLHSVKISQDDDKFLRDFGFKIGDYLLIEIQSKLQLAK